MLTILITDDAPDEREGIAFLIKEYGYPLNILLAKNGRAALVCLEQQHVDILFTDVRMPFMDGLQLTANAVKLYPKLKVILFSGFSEFEYAKTAMSLGVSNYILKPVNVDEFQHVMKTVMEEITIEYQEEKTLAIKQEYARKHILLCAVNKTLGNDVFTSEIMDYIICRYKRVMLLEFDTHFFETAGTEFEQTVLSFVNVPADYLNLNLCQSLLLFREEESDQKLSFYEVAISIHDQILSVYNQNCYIAVSNELSSINDLAPVYDKLEQLLEYRFFIPEIFIFNESQNYSKYFSAEQTNDQLLEHIQTDLKVKEFVRLKMHLELLYQKYLKKTNFSQSYVKFIFSNIYKDIVTQFHAISELELNNAIDRIYKSIDLHEINNLLQETVEQLKHDYISYESPVNREAQLVKQHIETHYGDDLDLVTLSSEVYISPRYLSTIFKKSIGCGLNKYIKTVRMEKAKELLENTNIKIVDICKMVGFRNLSYFCQNFREFYGETPEKYRRKGF